jgi:hypothetical protein
VLLTNLQYNNVGIGIKKEGMTDRCLFLILIPTFKIYVFCIPDRRMDKWTDRLMDKLIRCEMGNLLIGSSRLEKFYSHFNTNSSGLQDWEEVNYKLMWWFPYLFIGEFGIY